MAPGRVVSTRFGALADIGQDWPDPFAAFAVFGDSRDLGTLDSSLNRDMVGIRYIARHLKYSAGGTGEVAQALRKGEAIQGPF